MRNFVAWALPVLAVCAGCSQSPGPAPPADERENLAFFIADGPATRAVRDYLHTHGGFTTAVGADHGLVLPAGLVPAGMRAYALWLAQPGGVKQPVDAAVIGNEPFLPGSAIVWAGAEKNRYDGSPEIQLLIGGYSRDGRPADGVSVFKKVTAENIGGTMVILFRDEALAIAKIQQAVDNGKVVITGVITWQEAREIAGALYGR